MQKRKRKTRLQTLPFFHKAAVKVNYSLIAAPNATETPLTRSHEWRKPWSFEPTRPTAAVNTATTPVAVEDANNITTEVVVSAPVLTARSQAPYLLYMT